MRIRRNAHRILMGKLLGRWSPRRTKRTWENNIKMDLRGIN
jgi:hypothetical protein